MDDKKQKRRSVSAARLYWAIIDACDRYDLPCDVPKSSTTVVVGATTIDELLAELKDDNMEAAR